MVDPLPLVDFPTLIGAWRLHTKPKTWWKALAAAGTPGIHARMMKATFQ